MDDLLAEFVAETREMLQASESEIVAWEADPADRARLDAIFRFVHTVKGNCGFFDFPALEALSHAAESALAEVRSGQRDADAALVSAVLSVMDRIAEMVDAIEAGRDIAGDDRALILALDVDPSDCGEVASAPVSVQRDGVVQGGAVTPRTIRLPVELLDRVMGGVSDLVLARNDLARRFRDHSTQPELDGPFERLSAILGDVRDAVSRMRMQRIEHLFNAIPRMARDLSADLGKQVLVEIEGNGVELDREMIELVRDPLTHIVRNAIGHGIETPSERIAIGKHEIGLLSVVASQSGNRITLRIADDGRGLDASKIGAKAVSSGLISAADLVALNERERLDLIFEPGLSTADKVDAISGRGVGLDVVRANVERLGGTIEIDSQVGTGTVFTLVLPLTLSIIGGLTVECAGQNFAIPRSYVDEIVHAGSGALEFAEIGNARLVTFRSERIRYIALQQVLGLDQTSIKAPEVVVMVKLMTGQRFALGVDRVHDHEELVIKPVSPEIASCELYAGLTLLEDGRPILLLDIHRIALKQQLVGQQTERPNRNEDRSDVELTHHRKLMVFDTLGGSRRAMPMELVRRIDTIDASAVSIENERAQVVIDDAIYSLIGLHDGELPSGRLRLLRLSDGERILLHAVRSIADTVDIEAPLSAVADDPAIEGLALIEGKAIPVVDGHWLFSSHLATQAAGDQPTCALPEDSEWARTILAPLVRAAGYRVVTETVEAPRVAFVMSAAGSAEIHPGSTVIALRDHRVAKVDEQATIYRYDRTAIMDALARARTGGAV